MNTITIIIITIVTITITIIIIILIISILPRWLRGIATLVIQSYVRKGI